MFVLKLLISGHIYPSACPLCRKNGPKWSSACPTLSRHGPERFLPLRCDFLLENPLNRSKCQSRENHTDGGPDSVVNSWYFWREASGQVEVADKPSARASSSTKVLTCALLLCFKISSFIPSKARQKLHLANIY